MEKKEFLRKIQKYQRKLNRAELVQNLIFSLCIGAGIGILFQIVAFLVVFYPANWYSIAALLIAAVTAVVQRPIFLHFWIRLSLNVMLKWFVSWTVFSIRKFLREILIRCF